MEVDSSGSSEIKDENWKLLKEFPSDFQETLLTVSEYLPDELMYELLWELTKKFNDAGKTEIGKINPGEVYKNVRISVPSGILEIEELFIQGVSISEGSSDEPESPSFEAVTTQQVTFTQTADRF